MKDPLAFAVKRLRYGRAVDFESCSDGFEIIWRAQSATSQKLRTAGEYLSYSSTMNVAQMQRKGRLGNR